MSNEDRIQAILRLESDIRSCTRCRLCETRTHTVPGEGDFSPQIVFVGEGPGAEEDRLGRPFVGRSGRFLDGMIESVGLRREDVFITSVVKCRPPDNRDPRPDELAACWPYLDRQIELLAPSVVVTLGRFSMQRWFPGERITRIHGQTKQISPGRMALAMFHPAAALRNPRWRDAFAADMQKLPGLLEQL
ncbi:MAG: uracil-DNA glycosylase [Caldilineaceae bacterium]